jgi:hypothetical protein
LVVVVVIESLYGQHEQADRAHARERTAQETTIARVTKRTVELDVFAEGCDHMEHEVPLLVCL